MCYLARNSFVCVCIGMEEKQIHRWPGTFLGYIMCSIKFQGRTEPSIVNNFSNILIYPYFVFKGECMKRVIILNFYEIAQLSLLCSISVVQNVPIIYKTYLIRYTYTIAVLISNA